MRLSKIVDYLVDNIYVYVLSRVMDEIQEERKLAADAIPELGMKKWGLRGTKDSSPVSSQGALETQASLRPTDANLGALGCVRAVSERRTEVAKTATTACSGSPPPSHGPRTTRPLHKTDDYAPHRTESVR